jgi:hypothetical protein
VLTFCNKTIAIDAAAARIISGKDDFSGEEVVTKPHLIFWKKPVGVVAHVEFSICLAWKWTC